MARFVSQVLHTSTREFVLGRAVFRTYFFDFFFRVGDFFAADFFFFAVDFFAVDFFFFAARFFALDFFFDLGSPPTNMLSQPDVNFSLDPVWTVYPVIVDYSPAWAAP